MGTHHSNLSTMPIVRQDLLCFASLNINSVNLTHRCQSRMIRGQSLGLANPETLETIRKTFQRPEHVPTLTQTSRTLPNHQRPEPHAQLQPQRTKTPRTLQRFAKQPGEISKNMSQCRDLRWMNDPFRNYRESQFSRQRRRAQRQ
jgi:hypothetical protein